LQSLRLLLRLEGDKSVALAHASPIHDDLGALYRAVGAEDAGQIGLGGIAAGIGINKVVLLRTYKTRNT